MNEVSHDVLMLLSNYLEGTCHSIIQACEFLELDEGIDWEDKLLDVNIEICVGCDWWHGVGELEFIEEKNGGMCEQCREEHGYNHD